MSIYIHIPFCNNICSYCDFCKIFYNEDLVDKYLNALKNEINLNYKFEKVDTIYIGGGTPSCLSIKNLKKLFSIIKIFNLNNNIEFTFECNIDSLNKKKIKFLKSNNINRLSIGVQTFDENKFELLNRTTNYKKLKNIIDYCNNIKLSNISLDLMYGIDSNIDLLKFDLEKLVSLNPKHISCYSLSLHENTMLYLKNFKPINEDIDYKMYKYIIKFLKSNNYNHYETSNFSKKNYESKHNLGYWNNKEYYGFGLSASGYINNYRYTNTKNLSKYINNEFLFDKEYIDNDLEIKYELILNLRTIKGINKKEFFKKYNIDIKSVLNINELLKEKKLLENKDYIFISKKWIYKSNELFMKLI